MFKLNGAVRSDPESAAAQESLRKCVHQRVGNQVRSLHMLI
jgi:hypothetical protein